MRTSGLDIYGVGGIESYEIYFKGKHIYFTNDKTEIEELVRNSAKKLGWEVIEPNEDTTLKPRL